MATLTTPELIEELRHKARIEDLRIRDTYNSYLAENLIEERGPQIGEQAADKLEALHRTTRSLTKVVDAMLASGAFTNTHREILDEAKEMLRQ